MVEGKCCPHCEKGYESPCSNCNRLWDYKDGIDKKETLENANALIEMYKAGFLDGYKVKKNIRNKEAFKIMNKFYKRAFIKRFEKKINKELKKQKK